MWCKSLTLEKYASYRVSDFFFAPLFVCFSLFTSAECEVNDSRHSGMYQSLLFLTRLGMQSLSVFGFMRLFDEVRAELV